MGTCHRTFDILIIASMKGKNLGKIQNIPRVMWK